MTIDDLISIIKKHGRLDGWYYDIGGCEVLEYINDMEGFVELLREFKKLYQPISFVDNYPDPVRAILDGGVESSVRLRIFGEWTYVVMDRRSYTYDPQRIGGANDN